MLTSASALLLVEALAWLLLLGYSRSFHRCAVPERLVRLAGVLVLVLVCLWLAASLISSSDIGLASIVVYIAAHIGWVIERVGTEWARRRSG